MNPSVIKRINNQDSELLINLTAQYDFTGALSDSSGNGNDYIIIGGATYDDIKSAGKYGTDDHGVMLDGITDYLTAGISETLKSYAIFIKPTSNNKDVIQFAAGKTIEINSSNEIITNGLTNVQIRVNTKSKVNIILNEWSFIYVQFDQITADAIQLGYAGSGYFAGSFFKEKRYNRVLSIAEIMVLFREIPDRRTYIGFNTTKSGTLSPLIVNNAETLRWYDGQGNKFDVDSPTFTYPDVSAKFFKFGARVLTGITSLILTNQNITGHIPYNISKLTNIDVLLLNSNQLTGAIPATIGDLVNLSTLQLQGNTLSGILPPEIFNLTNVILISISNNSITGNINNIGNLTLLQAFYALNCSLSGTIPTTIGNCNNLAIFSMRNNNLSGVIPSAIQTLTNLNSFFIDFNQFTGAQLDTFLTNEYAIRVLRGNKSFSCFIGDNTSGISSDSVAKIEGTGIYMYGITDVNTTSNYVKIAGDYTTEYPISSKFTIKNSTGNDGNYTVLSSSYDGSTSTTITTNEGITDSTIDGDVGDGLKDRGCIVTYTAA